MPNIFILLRFVVLVSALAGFGWGGVASSQCVNCENPIEISHGVEYAGCFKCGGIFDQRQEYRYSEVWKYSCSNGGTCTITEEYVSPCDVCVY